jgi:hypothetical protein
MAVIGGGYAPESARALPIAKILFRRKGKTDAFKEGLQTRTGVLFHGSREEDRRGGFLRLHLTLVLLHYRAY